jgi:mRNA interferase HigB
MLNIIAMQVVARRTLREFWERQRQAEGPVRAWFAVVSRAHWKGPADVKRQFGTTVDFVGDNRVVFDLGGNKYRLIVHVSYEFGRVLVKFIGTHAEYDRIDAGTVSWRKSPR